MTESEYTHLQDSIKGLRIEPTIEAFENVYQEKAYQIILEFDEFTCVCPRTGLPDFATIIITYVPGKHVVESKSLKLYLNGYRNVGIFNENVVNKVLDDLVSSCDPLYAEVKGIFNSRGGVGITVKADHGDLTYRNP